MASSSQNTSSRAENSSSSRSSDSLAVSSRPETSTSTPQSGNTSRISVGNSQSSNLNSSTLTFGAAAISDDELSALLEDGDFDPGPTVVTAIPDEFLQDLKAESASSQNQTPPMGSPAIQSSAPQVATSRPVSRPALQQTPIPASRPLDDEPQATMRMAPPSREEFEAPVASAPSAATPVQRSPLPRPGQREAVKSVDSSTDLNSPEKKARPRLARPRQRLARPGLEQGFVFARKVALPSLWRRCLAGVLDLLLVLVSSGAITFLLGPKPKKVWPAGLQGFEWMAFLFEHRSPQLLFFVLCFLGLLFVYQLLFHAFWSRTPGKLLLGMMVVDMQGRAISWLGAIARAFAYLLFSGALLAGLSWILIDKQYRGLHDRASGSLVIRS